MAQDFAYTLYATNAEYLCNAVMMLDALDRVDAKASKLLLYRKSWKGRETTKTFVGRLLAKAIDLGAILQPITLQRSRGEIATWADSYTKLLAFNQTRYKRVLSLDTDATVLQNLDDVFRYPAVPLAAPSAYWLEEPTLSSQMMLIEPSQDEFDKITDQIKHHKNGEFDMEIINTLYNGSASLIPHRPYDLLTGEFQKTDHSAYLGDMDLGWNATYELANAKFVHFSDWPLFKPWLLSADELDRAKPPCRPSVDGSLQDCQDQEAWLRVYKDFMERRQRICNR
ncbi:hypothetical protein CAC42_551 [Sphaceloma murrayae]|uniref:Glucose N-acetyltransferase 1 n=1 Tax=Sphaceloma murrayae TaxID=2082308 RepID=A0A2K1R424_9PEZI|nr:hypothetical protein CAC42_551 [Sphaceloma murrayae]